MERPEAALFFEQGTGKTWVTGAIIESEYRANYQGLIVCLLTNKETTWLTFLKKYFRVYTDLEEFLEASKPRLLVMHWQQLTPRDKKERKKFQKKLAAIDWSLIALDESQVAKDRQALVSKAVHKLAHSSKRKLLLSGTPIEKVPQDLWSQFRFLAPEALGDWKDFEEKYLEQVNIDLSKYRRGSFKFQRMLRASLILKNKRKFREDKLPQFLKAIRPYSLRISADVLNLKSLDYIPVITPLDREQQRLYDQLEEDLVAKSKKFTVLAPLQIVKNSKLHQITGGYLIDEDGKSHEVGTSKLRSTVRLVKQHKKPIVIFCEYLEEVWAIHDELVDLDLKIATLTGKQKKQRPQIQADFQAGKYDVLICQIRTGGVGIDLYRSCVGIMYSWKHSSINFEQAVKRLHRRGQTRPVKIFLLMAKGTIDEAIYEAILSKGVVIDCVLSYLKRKHRNGQEGKSQEGKFSPIRGRQSRQGPRHSGRLRSSRPA